MTTKPLPPCRRCRCPAQHHELEVAPFPCVMCDCRGYAARTETQMEREDGQLNLLEAS